MHKYVTVLFCLCASLAQAQQKMSLQQCEDQFLKNNFHLLAEQYNIDIANAQVIQARLWENPYASADLNAVNPQDRKALDIGRSGQKAFAVQQLIYLGGKKKAEVELAKTNAQAAELAFNDLLRNLKFQLRTSFFSVYYDQAAIATLDKQLANLDTLIQSYAVQVQKGNLPLKDLVRLQSLYLGMKNERTELVNNTIEEQSKLALLLATEDMITPGPTESELQTYQKPLTTTLDVLQQTAVQHRADVQLAEKNKEAARWNVKWQQALSVPDLTLGAAYDQQSGAFNHQVNLTLGMPLRLWNRNQGNIKAADAQLRQAMVQKDLQVLQLNSEINTAYQKYLEAKNNYRLLDASLRQNFDDVYQGVYLNFQRRNISLIEFADFMESYHQSLIQFNQIQKTLINACEQINYATGAMLF